MFVAKVFATNAKMLFWAEIVSIIGAGSGRRSPKTYITRNGNDLASNRKFCFSSDKHRFSKFRLKRGSASAFP
jgi:hypothetical protein